MTKNKQTAIIPDEQVISKIYLIRGKKVMLDRDLAALYQVETRILNQAVRRNIDRFPKDFMFQLNEKDFENWKSQFVISNSEKMSLRKRPYAFTEQGVAMLSGVLNSAVAIKVHIQIIRVFAKMKELLLTHKDILLQLEILEKKFESHDQQIQLIFEHLKELLNPPQPARNPIGFSTKREE
ncbi:MAG TPA: ORF6N domain-containing protein [Parafilimonas sp.]|nr:ORF6N domain-containing protein [Parafilimonas sp.]